MTDYREGLTPIPTVCGLRASALYARDTEPATARGPPAPLLIFTISAHRNCIET